MKTEPTGAGTSRPPEAFPEHRHGFWDRVEEIGYRIPFRVKLALVWVVIFIILGGLFTTAKFDTTWMRDHAWFIVRGIWVTVFIAVVSIFFAVILALLGALGRLSKNPIAYGTAGFYTSFFRGTPLIVQLYLWYLGLAQIGVNLGDPWRKFLVLSAVQAGILGLSFNYGAYMTEIFRAGIQSVPHGQAEAAEALGMTYRQRMRRVVLPQAFRVIIPPTGNEFIAMMKDTALVSLLGTSIQWADPFRRATLLGREAFKSLEALLVAALMYWVLTGIFSYFQRKLETRLAKGYVRETAGAGPPRPKRLVPGSAGGGLGGGGMMVEVPEPSEDATRDDPRDSADG
jgi:polar amino acid transport system permease protein